ncbi:MAG TPA: bi-domain-containing oxidoreductase [Candidatus Bathyarchaeia archaeon]|jgi:polar amino acid transport system substrate-binding protein|nr:bi-domain-containing oxidoreductase [Candidatus Bathyarchaeia archaeon]
MTLGSKSLLGKALERPDLVRQLLQRLKTTGVADVLATMRSRLNSSLALGYSSAGVVLEVGPGVNEFAVGEPVACAGVDHASHAELNWVPKNLCVKIPPNVNFDSAASVALGAIALQGVRISEAKLGERVAVIGLGLVGQLTAQILHAAGCVVWGLDPDPDRVRLARELGADFACENRDWEQSPWSSLCQHGEGADAVIITAATSSTEPIELAGRLARDRGVVVIVGDVRADIPRALYYKKELQVRFSRSYGPGRYDSEYEDRGHDYPYAFVRWTEKRNMEAFLELVAQQKVRVEPLLTHRFTVNEASEAYRLLSGESSEKYVGILLTYDHPSPHEKKVLLGQESLQRPLTKGMGETIGVGWIGAGSFSRARLLPALQKISGVRLMGLANATGISAQQAARGFGFGYCCTDANEILNDPAIDAVFIGTRHHLHASLVIAALERGKHVFVEKPLCVNEAELNQISEAYAQSGRILTVGFNRRFSRFAEECTKLFGNRVEPLSMLYRVSAGRLPNSHWIYDPAQGHGRVIGEICHFVDLMGFLCSCLPVEVQAWPVEHPDADPEDNVHIHLRFTDGSRGEILYLSSGSSTVSKERVEVFGQGKTAICEDFRTSHFYRGNQHRRERKFVQEKGHRAELHAFVAALKQGGESPIPFSSLYASTLTTFRIRESLRCGRALPLYGCGPCRPV